MRSSLFFKIFSGYLFIGLLLSIFLPVVSFRIFKEFYINSATEKMKVLGQALEFEILPYLKKKETESLDKWAKELGGKIKLRITVIDRQGVVLADSLRDPRTMENHGDRPEVIQAFKNGVGSFSRYSTTIKEDLLYVALPVREKGEVIAVLRLSVFLRDLNNLLLSLRKEILKTSLVFILFCLVSAFVFTRSLTRTIKKLATAFHQVATGDFKTKVFFKRNDELKQLADNFNLMTEKIEALFNELLLEKENLNIIFASLKEGLAVLDEKGRIILSNESFKKLLSAKLVEGKFYWEVIREVKFSELIKLVQEDKKSRSEEIEVEGKYYLISATFLVPREQMVVVLSDITEIKNLEKIKRDFVINVSHELRTPLTAIKGFIETLEEEVSGGNKNYVEVIKKNTDRLISTVKDLLLLAELEAKGSKGEIEEVNLNQLIEDVVRLFKAQLMRKGLDFELRLDEGIKVIKGDYFKLEQMLINLIDNAVKYTERGKVTLTLKSKEQMVEIIVEDTGIGIPKEHISRIFERFYVVDKSRSKKLGGTGLGLSIVKHIVHSHQGNISVESALGRGTKFTVTLPINPA